METKYIIKDRIIYFNWTFNEPIDTYTGIMKNCTQIIFSNFDDHCKYIGSKFNHPLENSLDHQIQLFQLTFRDGFNRHLTNSIDQQVQLIRLTFGNRFNKPLTNSIDQQVQLTQLTFGFEFNHPLNNCFNHQTQLENLTFWHLIKNLLFCQILKN